MLNPQICGHHMHMNPVLVLIVLTIAYPLAVMQVYATNLMGLPWWGAVLVLCVAGLLWFLPASWLIRWMSRPDATT